MERVTIPPMVCWEIKPQSPILFSRLYSLRQMIFILIWLCCGHFSLRLYHSFLLSLRRPTGIRFHFFIRISRRFDHPHSSHHHLLSLFRQLCPPLLRPPKPQHRPAPIRRNPPLQRTIINTRLRITTFLFHRLQH